MNIKKSIILSAAVLAAGSVFSQTSNLKKAQSGIAEYEKFRTAGSPKLGVNYINNAKTAIDLASVHEKTKDLPETWVYYTLVYSNLANDNKSNDDATKAAEGLAKAKELDKDGKNKENIAVAEQLIYGYNFNQGVEAWQKNDFATALTSFEKGLALRAGDTTLTYYSGVAAIQLKDLKKGVERYTQLVDHQDFSEHKNIMKTLPSLYLNVQDTVNALKYAGIAAKQYPNDNTIVEQNINFNIALGNEANIVKDINEQITKDPTNKVLYFYLGIAESSLNNNDKALAAYTKATEIDPNYSDASLNAGVIVVNSVRDRLKAVNDDTKLTNVQYKAKIEELKSAIKPAEKFFNQVLATDAKSESALKGLKSVYDFLQDEQKSKDIQSKIDAL